MTEERANDCVAPSLFLKRPKNRAGLSRIDYRIGAYADFREAMMHKLNREPLLQAWTHRGTDDPGIALLEGAAILADIITFYQDVYANQAYLATATWRDRISDLVQLLGYRLSPGVGGNATFAFEVTGDKAVVIPKSFPVKADLSELDQPAEFQTKAEATAYPHLSRFHLYNPRLTASSILAGGTQLEVARVGSSSNQGDIAALEIAAGDRIMLMPDVDNQGVADPGQPAEILIVSDVEQVLDRKVITFEGSLTVARDSEVTAYVLGRTFGHFGHNAPASITKVKTIAPWMKQVSTIWFRKLEESTKNGSDYSTLGETEMPMDEGVNDLAAGGLLICQGFMWSEDPSASTTSVPFAVARDVTSVRADALKWGSLSGPSTVVTIESKLFASDSWSDIRQMTFHEVKGPAMKLRAATKWDEQASFTGTGLDYYGTYKQAVALAGRRLLLETEDGRTEEVTVKTDKAGFPLPTQDENQSRMWALTLQRDDQASFQLREFDEAKPKIAVYGNLVDADQGKAEPEAKLGNGVNRQAFQTFKLPKAPLTYHNTKGETPPEAPALDVYVNDRLWKRVPFFFGHTGQEQIYIVREDAAGDSWCQFGDGKTGARLPAGIDNVVAKFRTGTGAHGPLKAGTTPQGGARLDGLDKIQMPTNASGGAEPEPGLNAKEAAPGKLQSLGRLVALQDFEAEALSISGVVRATAAWQTYENVPSVVLTVLMETGRAAEAKAVQTTLNDYNRCRGPQRFPIIVKGGKRLWVYVALDVSFKPSFREELVRGAIQKALGVSGAESNDGDPSAGLFALVNRRFGETEYRSRIEGTVQNVEGVAWAKVTALSALGEAADAADLAPPDPPAPLHRAVLFTTAPVATAQRQLVLALHKSHLIINPVAAREEEC